MAYDAFTLHWKLDLLVDLGEESKKRGMKRGQRRRELSLEHFGRGEDR